MVNCDRCGKDVYMPFRCNYCGGYFCEEHRLPEFHGCTGVYKGAGYSGIYTPNAPSDPFYSTSRSEGLNFGRFRFSQREIRDLTIGLVVITLLPFTWFGSLVLRNTAFVVQAVGIFVAAFLLHELAHKFTAQRFGYWSEFRLNMIGLFITLISILSPLKIVAPGAVVIAGQLHGKEYGRISLAGPLTNITLAVMFLLLNQFSPNLIFWLGIYINSILALFNLIPFGLFDGAKIFRWNWKVWLCVVIIAGALFLYTTI